LKSDGPNFLPMMVSVDDQVVSGVIEETFCRAEPWNSGSQLCTEVVIGIVSSNSAQRIGAEFQVPFPAFVQFVASQSARRRYQPLEESRITLPDSCSSANALSG
jgi:hypothetical protein